MDDRSKASRSRARGSRSCRTLIAGLVLAAVVAVIWFGVHLARDGASGGAGGRGGGFGGRPSTTVGVATASLADIPITLDALGTVTPATTVTVVPQVSGVITKILFKEGQMVRRGQVLAVIDPRPLQMALLQAKGNLARDQAQLANAQLLLSRDRTLLAQDSIARQDVDTQDATVRQFQGVVMTDKAAVGTAELNLGYSRVVAPVAGRVGLRVVDVGNFIGAGASGGIVVLTEVAPIDVEFTVPQDDVPRIQTQAAQGSLPVTALDRTKTTVLGQGVFSTLDNQVDTTTGTVKAKARFDNGAGTLFPDQFVNVRIALQTLRNAVVVPVTAVRTGPDGDFVWLLNPDRTVSKVLVVRGPGTATTVSLTSGLRAGVRVITEGGDRLTDGGKVQLPGDKPGAGGGAAMQACAADAKKLCGGKQGREMFMCLRQNADQASAPCKAAMAARRHGGGGSGGGGGGYAGGQAGGGQGDSGSPAGASQALPSPPAAGGQSSAQTGGQTGGGQTGRHRHAATASPGPAPAAPAAGQAAENGGGGGGGGFTPSPEMLAARQAMIQACSGDAAKLCAGQQGREMFMCLRQNADKASASCQAAMAKMPHRRPGPGA